MTGRQHTGTAGLIATHLQFHPAEVAQIAAAGVLAMARYAGRIQVHRALPVDDEAASLPLAALERVVHVAEHHQGQRAVAADLTDCQRQVLIAPVTGRFLPVAAAGVAGLTAEAAGAAVGQQHQGQGWIGLGGRRRDPRRRGLQGERTEHGAHGRGEMEAAAGRTRPATDHGQSGELAQAPAAVERTEAIDLALQGAAAVITAGVVIAEHTGGGDRKPAQQGGDARSAVAEVAHQQQGIGAEPLEQSSIALIPGAMRIAHHRQALDPHRSVPRLSHPAL